MEEKVLWAEAGYKPITHIARRTRVGVIWQVTWKGTTILHSWHTTTFKLLLTQEGT